MPAPTMKDQNNGPLPKSSRQSQRVWPDCPPLLLTKGLAQSNPCIYSPTRTYFSMGHIVVFKVNNFAIIVAEPK